MKIILAGIIFLFLSACGGGGYGSNNDPNPSNINPAIGPLGIIPNQVEPVQTTPDNWTKRGRRVFVWIN